MKILIAILACHRYRDRAQAQRVTWVRDVPAAAAANGQEVDLRFFLGRSDKPYTPSPDECQLDVDDGYKGLPDKSRGIYRWALERGYDFVFKTDDDCYIAPSRLLASDFAKWDYSGRLRGPSGRFIAPYASGLGYWVSARAMQFLAVNGEGDGHEDAEDRWVGNTLYNNGITCHLDSRYVVCKSVRNQACSPEAPLVGNDVIAACEFQPKQMLAVHAAYVNGVQSAVKPSVVLADGEFARVSVLIKTFLRDGYLLKTVAAIDKHLPGMKMIIVDDGYASRQKIRLFADLRRRGHVCDTTLAFDSGFGAKANRGIQYMDREYTLIGCDDFDFAGKDVADGIRRMISVLDANVEIGSVGGRVDNHPYESNIEYGADYIREIRFEPNGTPPEVTPDGVPYYLVDMTVNYNMVRSKLLGVGRVTWVENKIGGDHFDFYHDMRRQRNKIAWVPGVNINQQRHCPQCQHHRYGEYRGRAKLAIPSFLRKFGITRYIGADGRVDSLEPA